MYFFPYNIIFLTFISGRFFKKTILNVLLEFLLFKNSLLNKPSGRDGGGMVDRFSI